MECRKTLAAFPVVMTTGAFFLMQMMIVDMRPADTHVVVREPSAAERWFHVDAASLNIRFHYVRSTAGRVTAENAQYLFGGRARLWLDRGRRFTVKAAAGTGATFSGGWNNTGAGTGQAQSNVFLKQLNLETHLLDGVTLEYGGLEFARGQSSEITAYDADGYLVGQRLAIRRPRQLGLDEISVTFGYVGDLNRAGVLGRLHRLSQSNYHQFLVEKRLGRRLRASADYSSESGVGTLRQAVTVRLGARVRFEQYERLGGGYGCAAYAEHTVSRKITAGAGYAQLDRPGRNSDRFGPGKRVFANLHAALSARWSFMVLATQAVSAARGTAPGTRLDIVAGYNIAEPLTAGIRRTTSLIQ